MSTSMETTQNIWEMHKWTNQKQTKIMENQVVATILFQ